jgi:hypothetical protein
MAEGLCDRAVWPPRPANGRGSKSDVNARLPGVLRHVGRCLPPRLCASFARALQGSGRSRGEGQAIVGVLASGNQESDRKRAVWADAPAALTTDGHRSGSLEAGAWVQQLRMTADRLPAPGRFALGAHGRGAARDD